MSANVLDFLSEHLADLPLATAEALVAFSCLGNECTLGPLSLATATRPQELSAQLSPAMERGVIVTPTVLAFHQGEAGVQIRFSHDRMQQAV